MRMLIMLPVASLAVAGCDIAQQAVENEIRAEVDATKNSLRNSTDLDERYGNITNEIVQGEDAVRARVNREINERVGGAANSVRGQEQ